MARWLTAGRLGSGSGQGARRIREHRHAGHVGPSLQLMTA